MAFAQLVYSRPEEGLGIGRPLVNYNFNRCHIEEVKRCRLGKQLSSPSTKSIILAACLLDILSPAGVRKDQHHTVVAWNSYWRDL